MEEVFRALASSSRRALLDRLAESDGLSLGELCEVLPELTRFGVSKHLGVLEAAELVVTERDGRRKLHYLNPVPIRRIHDRWISKYAEPFTRAMVGLADALDPDEEVGHAPGEAPLRDVHPRDAG